MDENLHKDNLEEFFRRSFEEQKNMPPEEDWDMPSENIWGGISAGISSSSISIPFYQNWKYWAVATAALFTVVFYQFWTYQHSFTQFSEKLEIQTEAFESLTKELEKERENAALLEEKIDKLNSEFQSNSKEQKSTQTTNNQLFNSENTTNLPQKRIIQPLPESSLSKVGNFSSNQFEEKPNDQIQSPKSLEKSSEFSTIKKSIFEVEKSETKPLPKTRIFASNISKLPSETTLVNFEKQVDLNINLPELESSWLTQNHQLKNNYAYQKWSISAHASPLLAKRNLKRKMQGFTRPFGESDLSNISYGVDLNLNYNINKKWSVWAGLSYQNLDLIAKHQIGFKYKKADTFIDDEGLETRDYEVDMAASFDNLEVELRVSNDPKNDGLDYDAGTPVRATVESNLHIETIGIPVGVSRNFDLGKKWSLSLKAAAVPTFIVADNFEINDIKFPDERLKLRQAKFKVNKYKRHLNSFMMDGQLAIGLRYKITQYLHLDIEPTFRKNLSPFMERPNAESNISSVALQTGVTFNF